MTWSSVLPWIATVATLVVAWLSDRAGKRQMAELLAVLGSQSAAELEVLGHMRRTMEDLQRLDPAISETVALGLAELERVTPMFEAFASGDEKRIRAFVRDDESR